tara:strand:+ start:570 stop:1214 length:645 start_codon:yes stop_codon:yes gene_type:complete
MTGKIKLVHSGGNSVSVAVPTNAPSASEVEFKLPQSDGSANQALVSDGSGNLSFASVAGGKILQVVSTTKTDTFSESVATTARSSIVTGLTATITPSATSSKIFVQYSVNAAQYLHYMVLTRNGSDLTAATGDASGSRSRITAGAIHGNDAYLQSLSGMFLDSPSSTSALTYGMKFGHGSGSTRTIRINYDNLDSDSNLRGRAISTITVMEIAA